MRFAFVFIDDAGSERFVTVSFDFEDVAIFRDAINNRLFERPFEVAVGTVKPVAVDRGPVGGLFFSGGGEIAWPTGGDPEFCKKRLCRNVPNIANYFLGGKQR